MADGVKLNVSTEQKSQIPSVPERQEIKEYRKVAPGQLLFDAGREDSESGLFSAKDPEPGSFMASQWEIMIQELDTQTKRLANNSIMCMKSIPIFGPVLNAAQDSAYFVQDAIKNKAAEYAGKEIIETMSQEIGRKKAPPKK